MAVNRNVKEIIVYIILLFSLWISYLQFVADKLKNSSIQFLFNDSLISINIFDHIARLLIFTLPVIIYLIHKREQPLEYLKTKANIKTGIKYGLTIGIVIIILGIVSELVIKKSISLNFCFKVDEWISGVLLIGFTEELVFRGLILQELMRNMKFFVANIITSSFFVLYHIPYWITHGINFQAGYIIYIFVFGCFQGYILKKSGSLWTCIIIHTINNLWGYALTS